MPARVTRQRETLECRPAGIPEPQELGNLVEGLAGGVIPRLTQQAIFPPFSGMEQQCMATRNE